MDIRGDGTVDYDACAVFPFLTVHSGTNDGAGAPEHEPRRTRATPLYVRTQAPNAFDPPLTGFAPASRCFGTRSRAGSEYPTETILSPR